MQNVLPSASIRDGIRGPRSKAEELRTVMIAAGHLWRILPSSTHPKMLGHYEQAPSSPLDERSEPAGNLSPGNQRDGTPDSQSGKGAVLSDRRFRQGSA